jgi:hypothetical protein
MVRHFRCLQEKEARQTVQKAVRKRQKEKERGGEGAGCRIRQRPTRLIRLRVDAHIRIRPSSREIRLEEGDESEQRAYWEVGSRAGTI